MNGEPLDIEPLPIQAKTEFTNKFDVLNPEQKEITRTFLYCSLQSCILDSERRIFDGYPGRHTDIMTEKASINMPDNLLSDELPERTDEQILLQISSRDRAFYPARFLSKNNSLYFLELIEIYINSSRIGKLAILKYLENINHESNHLGSNTAYLAYQIIQ